MPSYVDSARCDGCQGLERVRCQSVCPLDLMGLDLMGLDREVAAAGRAVQARNREPDACYECYACVKVCPRQAVAVRHAADLVALGARLEPRVDAETITWLVRSRNGTERRLVFPRATRPAPAADPYAGKPAADLSDLARPGFFNTGPGGLHAADPDQLTRT